MPNEGKGPHFNVSASLIRSLGERIAPDEVTAITELIKNAFDADAEWVSIEIDTEHTATFDKFHFTPSSTGFIKIEDNGKGMSWEEVQGSWLSFSFPAEQKDKRERITIKKRTPLGGRGMGRLGIIRLGTMVELFTSSVGEDSLNHVAVDWDQFTGDNQLTEIPLFSEQLSGPTKNGTSLYIFRLRDLNIWKGERCQELITDLLNKISPFGDRKSFRVTVKVDGREVVGLPSREKLNSNRVIIENAWQKMSPNLIQEVVAFWENNKMIKPGFSSEERARQAVLILRDADTKAIVGLSTAGIVTYKQLNSNNFYLYRSIILPGYRHPGLTSKVIVETRDLLEAYNKKEGNNFCKGILTFVENPRIQQFRREAIWPASKMAYIGMDKEGRHIRVYYFKGATI